MLTATQTKYARTRLEAIHRRRQEKINNAARESRSLSTAEKLAKLKAGEFSVTDDEPYNWHTAVRFETEGPQISPEEEREQLAALREEYDGILDKLVLGNADEAVALIAGFEAKA